MGVKHKGLCRHRLTNNPGEEVFAGERERVNKENKVLSYLLSGGKDASEWEVSQRDAAVAATVALWLGSLVGSQWAMETRHKAQEAEYKALKEGPVQEPEEGRIPIEDRPKKGEVWYWKTFQWTVAITYADPFGRWFDYEREETLADGSTVLKEGKLGQTELMAGDATRVKEAPDAE